MKYGSTFLHSQNITHATSNKQLDLTCIFFSVSISYIIRFGVHDIGFYRHDSIVQHAYLTDNYFQITPTLPEAEFTADTDEVCKLKSMHRQCVQNKQ